MAVIYYGLGVILAITVPGVYLGIVAAIAITICKALLKKR